MSQQSGSLKIISSSQKSEGNCISVEDLSVSINETLVLKGVNLSIRDKAIHCIIGPSGAGKSTLIRCFNRICDETEGLIISGKIVLNEKDIFHPAVDANELRREVGMVFQKPAVFPKSIKENVLIGVEYHKKLSKLEKLKLVEEKLKAVSLWSEVSHRLNDPAQNLSLGQQQRLCLARTLAVEPDVILLDEPTSSLDPVSSKAIEELMVKMKQKYTIIFVTHNIQQAHRIADDITFICDGKVMESGSKNQLFTNPKNVQTRQYLGEEYCDC